MSVSEVNNLEDFNTNNVKKKNKVKRRFFATGKWYKIALTLILWSVLQEILMASTDLIDNVFVNHLYEHQVEGFQDLIDYIKGTGWTQNMTTEKLNSVGLQSLAGYALDGINYTPGQIGVNAVSASNQLYIIMFAMVSGFCYGSGIFSAQYFGAGEYQKLKHITCLKMYLTLFITLIFAIIGIGGITKYFIGFTTHPDYQKDALPPKTKLNETSSSQEIKEVFEYIQNKVAILATKQGDKYYKIVSLSYPLLVINQVATTALRETRRPFYSFFMSSISLVANALCNVFLTAPTFIPNFTGYGVVGAALGTVSSRILQSIFILVLLGIKKFEFIPSIKHFKIPKYILRISLIKSLPILLNETLFALAQVVQVKLRAQYSADSLSANAMYETMLMAFFSPMYHGLNAGISTLVGNELGAQNFKKAKYNAKHLMRLSFMIACGFLVIFAGLSWVIPKLIFPNTTPEGIKIGEWMVFIYSMTYPVILMNTCVYSILRAGGNVVRAFLMDSAFNWVFQIPVLFILIHYNLFNNPNGFINLNIIYIHLIVCMFEVFKLVPSMIFYFRGKWLTSIIDETKFKHKNVPKDLINKESINIENKELNNNKKIEK
ncbi:MATE family efflux transporter [Spiroplasma gladiatoris]|uniref:Probable multidrug resistance protein NorM n=1 Tax=Spiroplasma gladiatoris TaxID=2143 RepID=A0A4P7AG93_9MOLU|nr:MATE family efflux transporter [Spiroplasma gladiatoris]QBQ07364.1 MATE family efflux transporter [Spiroplasma gladiatoris]